MLSFRQYIEEGYKNLFTDSQKSLHAKEAFDQLHKSYEKWVEYMGLASKM
jgi:hypothetical protein